MNKVILPLLIFSLISCQPDGVKIDHVIMISANAEWKVVRDVYPNETIQTSPWGEYFVKELVVGTSNESVIFFHGGWGKVAAAGSTQYCIDHWNPKYIVNIGGCGGFEGQIKKYDVVLVDKTIIYDIMEAMGDSKEAIDDYTVKIDLSWLGNQYPGTVIKTLLVSADRDLVIQEIPKLRQQYQAIAGDWETGAIAYTCSKNNCRVLILKGVTDLVSDTRGEAYGNPSVFIQGTDTVMRRLLKDLPGWLERCPPL